MGDVSGPADDPAMTDDYDPRDVQRPGGPLAGGDRLARARALLAAPPSKARGEALADLYDEIQVSKAARRHLDSWAELDRG
jgi:hypothetical protein